jgi:general secretion pathway protein J
MTGRRFQRVAGTSGFTLIEALIATALMGIVLTALATVTAQWLPNWNRGFVGIQRAELFAAGLDRLIADLSSAEFVSMSSGASPPTFDGTQLSVTFVRTELGPNAANGLEIVRIAEISDQRNQALVRTRAPFRPAGPDGDANQAPNFGDPVVVIRAPYRVSFSYAGPDRVWRNAWQGASQLPRAIRVTVRDAATGRILSVSTATTVYAQVPQRCVTAKTMADCLPDSDAARSGPRTP